MQEYRYLIGKGIPNLTLLYKQSLLLVLNCCNMFIPQPIMGKWFYLQDTCGVHNLHGLPGVLSGIAVTIAASVDRKAETDDNHVAYGDR